jgi:hypothetical protein
MHAAGRGVVPAQGPGLSAAALRARRTKPRLRGETMKISARNQFQGKVASVTLGPVNVSACPPDCVI